MTAIYRAALAVLVVASATAASTAHEGEHGGKHPAKPPRKLARKAGAVTGGKTLALQLKGLHCAGCAMSVRSRLMKVSGVASASVDPEKQSAVVTLHKGAKRPTDSALKDAVKSAGYVCTTIRCDE